MTLERKQKKMIKQEKTLEIKSLNGDMLLQVIDTEINNGPNSSFHTVDIDGEILDRADLRELQFQGGCFENCSFEQASLKGASFEGVMLFGSVFKKADMRDVEFYLVLALGASFVDACLENAKFLGGSFENVNFSNANLNKAHFAIDNIGGEVLLCGANFFGANLSNVMFDGAIYDEKTVFPLDFSPELHGLIKR